MAARGWRGEGATRSSGEGRGVEGRERGGGGDILVISIFPQKKKKKKIIIPSKDKENRLELFIYFFKSLFLKSVTALYL